MISTTVLLGSLGAPIGHDVTARLFCDHSHPSIRVGRQCLHLSTNQAIPALPPLAAHPTFISRQSGCLPTTTPISFERGFASSVEISVCGWTTNSNFPRHIHVPNGERRSFGRPLPRNSVLRSAQSIRPKTTGIAPVAAKNTGPASPN